MAPSSGLPTVTVHATVARPGQRVASSRHHQAAGLLVTHGTSLVGAPVPPVGTTVIRSRCHTCASPLTWHPPKHYTLCPGCALTNVMRGRTCPHPATPALPTADPTNPNPCPVLLCDPAMVLAAHGRVLAVEDFLWASMRRHPSSDDWLILARRDVAVALLPARWAAAVRATCLLSWRSRVPSARLTEPDVVAYTLASVLTTGTLPPPPPGPFPGDGFLFAPHTWLHEAGALRPIQANPVVGTPHPAHPAASPYLPVEDYGLPLNPDAHLDLLAPTAHPYTAFIVNSLRVGFPTTATPPAATRSGKWAAPSPRDPLVAQALQRERDIRAIVDASDWSDHGVPLRFAPLYAILKSSGVAKRLVQDLSAGADAVNDTVHTAPLPPVRLAHVARACQHVLYLKAKRPGVPVLLTRVDLRDAYRTVPLASNCRWQIVHRLRSGAIIANNALVLGMGSACAAMGSLPGALEDVTAETYGTFSANYVDDIILVAYEDEMPCALRRLLANLRDLGWVINEAKLLDDGPPGTAKQLLGVHVDTEALTVSIPPAKLAAICADLARWRHSGPNALTPSHARRLSGILNWAATTLPLAKPFLAPLYEFGYTDHAVMGLGLPRQRHRPPPPAALDAIDFWQTILAKFNGVSSFAPVPDTNTVTVWSDASGRGWGFVEPATGQYAHGKWSKAERKAFSTTHWEALSASFAGIAFGPRVAGGVVKVLVDSSSSQHAFTRLRCRDHRLRDLLRVMCLLQIECRFRLVLEWTSGASNVWADFLSRHDHFPTHLWPSSCPAPQRLRAYWRPRPTPTTTPASSTQPPPSPSSPSLAPGKPTARPSITGSIIAKPWDVAPSTLLPVTLWKPQVVRAAC